MKKNYLTLIFAILSIFCAVSVNGQTSKPTESSINQNKEEIDKPLKIKKFPYPKIPSRCSESVGYIALNITFDKSGKITNVEIVNSVGCKSFEMNAIDAAKKIKFEPEIKNGEPITIVKRMEYSLFGKLPNLKKIR